MRMVFCRRARSFAKRHGVPLTFDDYAALIASPEVDDATIRNHPTLMRSGPWSWAQRSGLSEAICYVYLSSEG